MHTIGSLASRWYRAPVVAAGVMAGILLPVPEGQSGTGWRYEVTPYAWGAGLDGTTRIQGRPSDGLAVEQSFSDIWEKLDFALMGAFEARRGRWSVRFDGVYFEVGEKGGVTGPRGFVSIDADASVTQELYAVSGGYRVLEGDWNIDVIAGARYNAVEWDVEIDASAPVLPVASRRFDNAEDWVDPYIGVGFQRRLGDRWSVLGYGDVGGFGVGSKLSYQLIAGIDYRFAERWAARFGYRHVDNDYDDDGFEYDVASSGPYAGLGFTW